MIQVHLTRCGPPSLQLTIAPLRQIVHVLKQFWPCHHTGCRIWCHKVGASALGESANLLAHINTHTSELVLHLHAVSKVLSNTSLLALCTLHKRCLLCPRLQLTMSPLGQVVHVLEQFWPSHHTRGGVGGNKIRACALGEGTNLLAHVDTDASKLILKLSAVLQVFGKASLLALGALHKRGLLIPCLKLTMPPLRQVVHVLKKLRPSHHTGCRVWGHKVGASALREGPNLFAHVDAHSSKLVLHLRTVSMVLSQASFLTLLTLCMKTNKGGASALWEGANLLAHINANSGQLILQVCTVFQVLSGARGGLTHLGQVHFGKAP